MRYGDEMRRTASLMKAVPADMKIAPKLFLTLFVPIDERGHKSVLSRAVIKVRDVQRGGQTVRVSEKWIQRTMMHMFEESAVPSRHRKLVFVEALFGSVQDKILAIIENANSPYNCITAEFSEKNAYVPAYENYYETDDACLREQEVVFAEGFDFRSFEEEQLQAGKVILSDVLRIGNVSTFGFNPSSAMYCEVDAANPATQYMNWANLVQLTDKTLLKTPVINSFSGAIVLDGSMLEDTRNPGLRYGVFTPSQSDRAKRMTVAGLVFSDFNDRVGGSVIVEMHDDVKVGEITAQRTGKISILQDQIKTSKGPLVILANGTLRIADNHPGSPEEGTLASRFIISISNFSMMKPMMSERTQVINKSVTAALLSVKPIDPCPITAEIADLLADGPAEDRDMTDLHDEKYESQIG